MPPRRSDERQRGKRYPVGHTLLMLATTFKRYNNAHMRSFFRRTGQVHPIPIRRSVEAFLGDDEKPDIEARLGKTLVELCESIVAEKKASCANAGCQLSAICVRTVFGTLAPIDQMHGIFPGDPGWAGDVITVSCESDTCPDPRTFGSEGMIGKTADAIVKLGD
ncbi:MAG: hypothetical protein JWO35_129 [Candidatus Saccharibacteria bacterium]|nr:hypothetical protein [Candidatus Saccharibacteria bacterium]